MIISVTTKTLANFCKAVSDPLRLMILRVLLHNSFSVLELTQIFGTTQSGMSHHLKVLAQAGLVVTRREGNSIFYRRALPVEYALANFHQSLLDEVDLLEVPEVIEQNVKVIYSERADSSRSFFTNLARTGGLDQQDVIVGLGHYQETVLKLLDSKVIDSDAVVLEVGPGEGKLLPELAKRFNKVIAVDNSVEMLQWAKRSCDEQQLANVYLQKADAMDLQLSDAVDCIVVNMVLHHLPSPIEALKHFKSCLNDSGRLLITELCHHEQSWVTDTCGDLWLGFDPDELTHWAQAAGFKSDESLYIGLRNGFQLQIRHFCVA